MGNPGKARVTRAEKPSSGATPLQTARPVNDLPAEQYRLKFAPTKTRSADEASATTAAAEKRSKAKKKKARSKEKERLVAVEKEAKAKAAKHAADDAPFDRLSAVCWRTGSAYPFSPHQPARRDRSGLSCLI